VSKGVITLFPIICGIIKAMRILFFMLFFFITHFAPVFAWDNIDISIKQPPNAPYFIGLPEMNIDAEEFSTLILNIKSCKSGAARLFWASSYDPQINEPKSIWFYLDKSNEPKEYVFNVKSQNPNWIGFIPQVLIYPENGMKGVQVDSARAIPGNLFTTIKSGWREFWGPRGRMVVGSTINLIPSSSLFGRSINLYIYWIVILTFFSLLAYHYLQNFKLLKDPLKTLIQAYPKAFKQSLILMFSLWFLLAVNTDINYFNIFKSDMAVYGGKTLGQKRALIYGQDYYAFLTAAREKLPLKPAKFAIISSKYAADHQARIFLVPHVLTTDLNDKDLEYILAFHPPPAYTYYKNKFKFLIKFNADEYILRKY
jgi:hypothetical protein